MSQNYPFVNPPLPYDYDALEPYIDTGTMILHHDAHLQTYVDNLNKLLRDYPQFQKMTLTGLIQNVDTMPYEIAEGVKNNAGGVYNHIMYFNQLTPPEGYKEMEGELAEKTKQRFGSADALRTELKKAALSVFGSGNAWLVTDRNNTLQVVTTKNQDNPFASGLRPLLIIDVWEHAYYLKHYNKRAEYIDDFFRVVDWEKVGDRLS